MDGLFLSATPRSLVGEFLLDEILLGQSAYIHAAKHRGLHIDLICFTGVMVQVNHCLPWTPLLYWSSPFNLFIYLDWLIPFFKVYVIMVKGLPTQQVLNPSKHGVEQRVL